MEAIVLFLGPLVVGGIIGTAWYYFAPAPQTPKRVEPYFSREAVTLTEREQERVKGEPGFGQV